jgi:hypothetical protein
VIVAAFIIAMLMAPTTNLADQLVLAGPIILAYQIGVFLIWRSNRRLRRPKHVIELLERDRQVMTERLLRAERARAELAARRLPVQSRPVRRAPLIT